MVEDEPGETTVCEAMHDLHARLDVSPELRRQWYGTTADKYLRANGFDASEESVRRPNDLTGSAALSCKMGWLSWLLVG